MKARMGASRPPRESKGASKFESALQKKTTPTLSGDAPSNKKLKTNDRVSKPKHTGNEDGERDTRFDAITKDPKFRSQNYGDKVSGAGGKKLVVDERFTAMFTDDEFKSSRAKVDKYGRKVKETESSLSDLTRHYKLSEQEEERLEKLNRIARGEESLESDSSDESDEESGLVDADDDDEPVEELLPAELGLDSSRRLAIVGCDWDHIRAVDLFAVLKSFVPSTGAVIEVAVFSSEFGRTKMAMEAEHGPFYEGGEAGDENELGDDGEGDDSENEGFNAVGDGFDPEKLRKYEKDRLLYFVGVVTCDSVETAEALYRECDGLEFEHSATGLDLRFIPDDIKFNPEHLRDRSEEVPENYAPLDFVNKSVQQTTVQLTWDEPEHDRRKLMQWDTEDGKKKKSGDTSVPLSELEAFIASEDEFEDSDEEEEKRVKDVERYRSLLTKVPTSTKGGKKSKGDEDETIDHDDFFNALDEDGKDEDARTPKPFERPRGHKHNQDSARFISRESKDLGEDVEDQDEEGQDRTRSRAPRHQATEDDNDKKKSRRKKRKQPKAEQESAPEIDVSDERFAPLFTEPEFAIDRTDPRFKKTAVVSKIEDERRKRMSRKGPLEDK